MATQVQSVTNRNNLRLVVQVDANDSSNKLAFVQHGFKGHRHQPHIVAVVEALLECGYRVVSFDTSNSIGESEGRVEDATYDNYIADLEDVIQWAAQQEWYQEPFLLAGHSMGAQSVAWYAAHHPEKVEKLLPLAPPVNYDLYIATMGDAGKKWQAAGYKEVMHSSGLMLRASWNTPQSIERYNLLPVAPNITMPVLNIVGSHDEPCPISSQKQFMARLGSSDQQLSIIDGAQHSYRNAATDQVGSEISQMRTIIARWLGRHSA